MKIAHISNPYSSDQRTNIHCLEVTKGENMIKWIIRVVYTAVILILLFLVLAAFLPPEQEKSGVVDYEKAKQIG